jgi:hypothetical protein
MGYSCYCVQRTTIKHADNYFTVTAWTSRASISTKLMPITLLPSEIIMPDYMLNQKTIFCECEKPPHIVPVYAGQSKSFGNKKNCYRHENAGNLPLIYAYFTYSSSDQYKPHARTCIARPLVLLQPSDHILSSVHNRVHKFRSPA